MLDGQFILINIQYPQSRPSDALPWKCAAWGPFITLEIIGPVINVLRDVIGVYRKLFIKRVVPPPRHFKGASPACLVVP